MSFLQTLFARKRLIIATALLLSLAGLASWSTMPREEDPQFPERNGLIVTPFPGADAITVERLVVEPIEEHLAEIEEIDNVYSTARAGVAVMHIELHSFVYNTDAVWDDVEDALNAARLDFPAGVLDSELQDELTSQTAVVLALGGSADPLQLAQVAERVKFRLLSLAPVREVEIIADPGEQITIEYDDAIARRLGVDPQQLGLALSRRSAMAPGGMIYLGPKTANLRPQTEFRSLDEIRNTPILLPSGTSVPLGTFTKVRLGPTEPATARMRFNGEPVIGIGIIPKDEIDRVQLGGTIRERLAEIREEIAPLTLEEVVFQPDQVASRLDDLGRSLKLGILIVACVLFLAMGLRLGLLVSLVVPLVTFGSIAIFDMTGGILHQISIAALVIALGMLVDNAIVVSEDIQWRIDQGIPAPQAAVQSVRALAIPLGTATGTTLAAFIPMAISPGNTADFTRSIPILILLTLTVSYLFAVLVTPVFAQILLKKRGAAEARPHAATQRLARFAVSRPVTVLAVTVLLLGLTVVAAGWVDQQFFPAADRNLVLVDLKLPEGTHIEHTSEVSRQLEHALQAHPDVASVTTFVGRSAPHFYYNLQDLPNSPHLAQVMAETKSLEAVEPLMAWVRQYAGTELVEAEIVARRLEQGPSIEAPVEIRLYGDSLADLSDVAETVLAELRGIEGTRDVRHSLSLGAPTVNFEIDDAAAARHGLSRSDIASVLVGRTLGMEIGQYRMREDPIPILIRSSAGEYLPAADLATVDIAVPGRDPVPLAQLASLDVEWRPAAIQHHYRSRVVKVQSQVAEGFTSHTILTQLRPRLDALALPAGIRLTYGGEIEESGNANAALLRSMPLGAMLLLFFLLAQFNSFRRVGVVLVTVPLAAVGVVPGLLLSGQPFGFMATLGVVALIGIVVNNAIVLLDVIENRRDEGADIEDAVIEAVERRTRPIVLTMGTTVAGLLPLAVSPTTLWPPLAWAMISGLLASSLLTLFVVPAIYMLLFRPRFFSRPFSWGRRDPAMAES